MSDLILVDAKTSDEVLRSWAFDLPKLSYDASFESIEANNETKAIEKAMKSIESDVLLEVNKEKDVFTNQATREAEVFKRLEKHEGYQKFESKLREFYSSKDKAKIKAEYYDKIFSVVKNLLYDSMERERLEIVRNDKKASMEALKSG